MVAPWIKKQHPAEFDDAPAPKPEVEAEVVADDSVKPKNTEKPKRRDGEGRRPPKPLKK